ncbi:MAG TPA: 50S ribosomal protein L32 [candidate division Zixibacteria bacterium]|nr:50S ribosomal protein L32 [candidate division Zixibacteria bacterium]
MPNPKRRHSRTRGRKRRTHWKIEAPNLVDCPQCHHARMSHHICPNCGFYNGRQIIEGRET